MFYGHQFNRDYTLTERLMFANMYQQPNYRINKNQQWPRKAAL